MRKDYHALYWDFDHGNTQAYREKANSVLNFGGIRIV